MGELASCFVVGKVSSQIIISSMSTTVHVTDSFFAHAWEKEDWCKMKDLNRMWHADFLVVFFTSFYDPHWQDDAVREFTHISFKRRHALWHWLRPMSLFSRRTDSLSLLKRGERYVPLFFSFLSLCISSFTFEDSLLNHLLKSFWPPPCSLVQAPSF